MNRIRQFLTHEATMGPFGLIIGYPVQQSLPPEMHNAAAAYHGLDFSYHRLEVHPDELNLVEEVIHHPNFRGANVTVPHKIDISRILDSLSDEAHVIGAVNTIVIDGKKRVGHNTDAYGFVQPLVPHRKRLIGRNAAIFGTGGATRAIVYALNQLGMETIWLVARQPHTIDKRVFFASTHIQTIAYANWTTIADSIDLVVNATPLGMIPDIDSSPIEASEKDALIGKIVYDIVYKPIETRLLTMATQVMAETIDGVGMLVNQGAKAFEMWTGLEFPVAMIDQRIRDILHART